MRKQKKKNVVVGINVEPYPGKIKELQIELFAPRMTIRVFKVDSLLKFMEGFIPCFDEGVYTLPDKTTEALVLRDLDANGPIIYVIFGLHPTERTIAHEAVHVSTTICRAYDIDDEEFQAYLVGNLTEAIVNWKLPY
jgi:hypothetical protein